jgi:acylpyruvate hydrolase
MRLISYQIGDQARCGISLDGWIIDFQRAASGYFGISRRTGSLTVDNIPSCMQDFLNMGAVAIEVVRATIASIQPQIVDQRDMLQEQGILVALEEAEILAPVPRPGKIICVAGNYPISKAVMTPPEYPILFLKPSSGVIGPHKPIVLPKITQNVAYEVELGVVIGKRGKRLDKMEAASCIAGYMVANDLGDRDLEKRTSQWTTGKLMDTFTPLGPALVTPDEVPNPNGLELKTLLNGEIVQQGSTADMFFDVLSLVSYISELTTLEPGDIILTGSPKLMGDALAPAIALKSGDTIEVKIGSLGWLSSPVFSE